MTIEELKLKYRYPEWVKHNDYFGPGPEHEEWFKKLFQISQNKKPEDIKIVLELGSFAGMGSTRLFSKFFSNATIICVDVWNWPNNNVITLNHKVSDIMFSFLANTYDIRDKIIPLNMKVSESLEFLNSNKIIPDLVFHDASHTYPEVLEDLEMIHKLFPSSAIFGHDFNFEEVKKSVLIFSENHSFTIKEYGTMFYICK